jgi:hypothetical protein
MDSYTTCTTKEFKKDLIELCEKCPLNSKIKNGIKNQIIRQAQIQKELLTKSQFENYINNEIEDATKVIQEILLIETNPHQGKEFLQNRTELYIWNKERINALNKFLVARNEKPKKSHPKFFLKYEHFEFAEKLIKNIDRKYELAECSFIYRAMINDGFIDADYKHKSIIDFFSKYDLVIDRIKTYADCKNSKREKNYSTSKDSFQLENNCVL